ncbi:response regulator transcription factor [Reichenbachiella carrageenanivorans]|uniref:Response regulator transcription factor n=1 Tax=Reichenbachiella carrageenanivorans TaxID=2979869 RepID=A0ABY6D3V6_9BACT|nr:response regulator transcription factor [Reichenbachiella carrageenanivorans]UXX80830.1 response regulator transcription factor [Reichenbachiella carrageenanivorans]
MHTLFLIDDHKVVRDGVKAIMLAKPNIKIIGEAASGAEALSTIKEKNPDLVFVDLKLPDDNGSKLISQLMALCPNAKFALLTAEPNPTDLQRAQDAGALAFLTKDMETTEYLLAIDKMTAGKRYISAAFTDLMINTNLNYTPREVEVLKGFSDGLSYKEIGAKLDISPRTVETHKLRIMEKMKVKTVVEMVRQAIREGLICA